MNFCFTTAFLYSPLLRHILHALIEAFADYMHREQWNYCKRFATENQNFLLHQLFR